jgi:hypothetical protein
MIFNKRYTLFKTIKGSNMNYHHLELTLNTSSKTVSQAIIACQNREAIMQWKRDLSGFNPAAFISSYHAKAFYGYDTEAHPWMRVVYVHRLGHTPICFTCSIVSITLCTRASCQLYIRVEKEMKNFDASDS